MAITPTNPLPVEVFGAVAVTITEPLEVDGTVNALPVPPTVASTHWSNFAKTDALEDTVLVAGAPALLRDCSVYLDNSAGGGTFWVMIFNKADAPVNTNTPLCAPQPIVRKQSVNWDFGLDGKYFSAGIQIAISTTEVGLTLAGAVALFEARYRT